MFFLGFLRLSLSARSNLNLCIHKNCLHHFNVNNNNNHNYKNNQNQNQNHNENENENKSIAQKFYEH